MLRTLKTRSFAALFALFALLAAAPSAPAQEEQPAGVFGERIDVRVVNVEVVVTDKKGNRVPDLTASDFRLRVDGKEVPIEYFTEVRGGQAIAAAEGAKAPVPGLAGLAPGSDVGTSYLVFVDDFFSVADRRDRVLRALKDDLGRLGPEDRMAIVAYDGKSLDMLSTWSGSANALARALDQAMVRRSHGLERRAELRSFEVSRRQQVTGFGGRDLRLDTQLRIDELQYAQAVTQQVERSVAAAVTTLRGFASPPGRKVMLLLSGGWPYAPADWVINDPGRTISERDLPQGDVLFRPLTDTANLLGYTVYPVDVPGLDSSIVDAGADAPPTVSSAFNLRENSVHDSLQFVARETGGEPLLNGANVQALGRAAGDTRSYYWLGFTPQREGNDKRHEIEIDVRRPGLAARTRDSYRDLSRQSEVSMMVESALFFGNPPGTQSIPVKIGTPRPSGRREMDVPLSLALPVDAITLVPLEGKQVAELELRVAAVDVKGNRSDVPVTPLRLSTDKPPAPGGFVRYDTTLKLRRLAQRLVISIFDPAGGKLLAAQVDVAPPKGSK